MMPEDATRPAQAAIRTDLGAIFVSMELSRRAWLVTSLSPGAGEKMSKHSVPASDVFGLLPVRRAQAQGCGADRLGLPDYRHHNSLACPSLSAELGASTSLWQSSSP